MDSIGFLSEDDKTLLNAIAIEEKKTNELNDAINALKIETSSDTNTSNNSEIIGNMQAVSPSLDNLPIHLQDSGIAVSVFNKDGECFCYIAGSGGICIELIVKQGLRNGRITGGPYAAITKPDDFACVLKTAIPHLRNLFPEMHYIELCDTACFTWSESHAPVCISDFLLLKGLSAWPKEQFGYQTSPISSEIDTFEENVELVKNAGYRTRKNTRIAYYPNPYTGPYSQDTIEQITKFASDALDVGWFLVPLVEAIGNNTATDFTNAVSWHFRTYMAPNTVWGTWWRIPIHTDK